MGVIVLRPASPGSGAGTGATDLSGERFVVVSGSSALANDRTINAGEGIKLVDNGANGTIDISISMVWFEIPSGSIDGVNDKFELDFKPTPEASLLIFKNGLAMMTGSGCDYVLSGTKTICFEPGSVPPSGSNLFVRYAT